MPIFLPIAHTSMSLILLLGMGVGIGFLSGLLGVGGGFLLTPLLIVAGISPAVAAASGSNTVVATSASGTAAHFRLGNVDVKIGFVLLFGGLVGGGIGVRLIEVVRALGESGPFITGAYILVLGSVGGVLLIKCLRRPLMAATSPIPARSHVLLDRLPLQMDFPRSGFECSVLVPFGIAAMVGVLTSMGMGGGFVLVPLMVYLLGMPPRVAVGTSLFQIFFTSCGVTFMEATTNHTVDIMLVLPLAIGSAIGAQIGAHLTSVLHGHVLMILLAVLVLLVMVEMVIRILRTPANPLVGALAQHVLTCARCGLVTRAGAHT